MDKELFERLVKEAGIESFYGMNGWDWHIRQFAHLVAEECAKTIEAKSEKQEWAGVGSCEDQRADFGYSDSAEMIRAKFPPLR